MTKRISQANTVVVPAVQTNGVDGKVVAAKAVVVPAEADAASAKAEVKTDEAPEVVVALAAPAPMAMVAQDTTTTATTTAEPAPTTTTDDGGETDKTPYIVGGALLAGGILAIALSSGDDNNSTPAPAPAPTPTPTNTAPTFTAATATATVVENTAATTTVFTAVATDAQSNTITYSLAGTDAGLFNINASTGVVTLRTAADFETKASYTFTVTATDNATPALASTQTVTLSVTNVNEAPTFTSGATATIAENVAAGTAVYTSVTTDPEGTARTYSLGGTDASAFTINTTTGVVSINASPDFETKASYSFTVNASDGTNTAARPVTLSITDVVETPVGTTTTVSLDTAATTTVSGFTATGGTQATIFTDAAGTPSNATINNFGSDDIVRFTGVTSVSFSSVDNDLLIQFTSGGNVNDIKINDIVSPNAIITNEANAEAAVNAFFGTTGGDYFRFA